jgi:hypothetical protein
MLSDKTNDIDIVQIPANIEYKICNDEQTSNWICKINFQYIYETLQTYIAEQEILTQKKLKDILNYTREYLKACQIELVNLAENYSHKKLVIICMKTI